MPRLIYAVVQHDEAWAYKVGDVFSEPFATREEAHAAAEQAAASHRLAGPDEHIEYQDPDGGWHEEDEDGAARPETGVTDSN